jgi:hypothetical protein
MPSSRHRGFSPFMKPMCRRVNPDEETTDWRAVCGRTACTVRRAGRARALSDPYQGMLCHRLLIPEASTKGKGIKRDTPVLCTIHAEITRTECENPPA